MTTTRTESAGPAEHTRPNPVLASIRAELLRLRRWPAAWVVMAAWLVLNAMFGYVFGYVTYTSGNVSFATEGQTRAELLGTLLPSAVADTLPQGMPMFGGALMMVLGAIIAGNGFGWGTWKTVLTQGPSRTAVTLGSLLATALMVLGLVVATLACDTALSLAVAGLEGMPVTWPGPGELATSFGIAVLVMETWAFAGFLLGMLARGPAVSVGLGLVWGLVIENLLRGVGASLSWVERLTELLPGTATGSLVGRFVGVGGPDPTPGLLDTLSSGRALVTTLVYLVALPALTLWLVRRRDVS